MKEDGSAKKQLTKALGDDGGAVFSRDGKHLVWRANHPSDEAVPLTRAEDDALTRHEVGDDPLEAHPPLAGLKPAKLVQVDLVEQEMAEPGYQ